jgi:hypothetical protein
MLTHPMVIRVALATFGVVLTFASQCSDVRAGVQTFTFVDISEHDLDDPSLDVNIDDFDSALSHPGHSTPALISAALGGAGLPDVGLPSVASMGRSSASGNSRELPGFTPQIAPPATSVPGNEYFESPLDSSKELETPTSTLMGAGSSWTGNGARDLAGKELAAGYGSPNMGASGGSRPSHRGLPAGDNLPSGNEIAGGGGSAPTALPPTGPLPNLGGPSIPNGPSGPNVGPGPNGLAGAAPVTPPTPWNGLTISGAGFSLSPAPPAGPIFQEIGNISSPAGAPHVASNYSAGPDDNEVWIPQAVQTPVGQDMPEPGTLLIWGGLATAVAYRFRKRLGA